MLLRRKHWRKWKEIRSAPSPRCLYSKITARSPSALFISTTFSKPAFSLSSEAHLCRSATKGEKDTAALARRRWSSDGRSNRYRRAWRGIEKFPCPRRPGNRFAVACRHRSRLHERALIARRQSQSQGVGGAFRLSRRKR